LTGISLFVAAFCYRVACIRGYQYPGEKSNGGHTVAANKMVIATLLCAAVALVACRREETHAPIKLGAYASATQQAAR
jgi:hypothetical protein